MGFIMAFSFIKGAFCVGLSRHLTVDQTGLVLWQPLPSWCWLQSVHMPCHLMNSNPSHMPVFFFWDGGVSCRAGWPCTFPLVHPHASPHLNFALPWYHRCDCPSCLVCRFEPGSARVRRCLSLCRLGSLKPF